MRKLLYIFAVLFTCLPANSQNQGQEDSLVVLMSSKSAQLVDIEGASYRKVVGPARFLHNNTYLLCDTAMWNVDSKYIEAWGNVSIMQEETVLTSDKLTYLIDDNLAKFRGTLVQLQDKDHNVLRTRNLDYNTKDSLAVFNNGGAMRDKDGQIIESRQGTYDSKAKMFTFRDDVNMFTDSIFVKTRSLVYLSDQNLAKFGQDTNAWKDDNMLSSDAGWYDRGREVFLFNRRVHVMSEDQEGWSDSLYFHRNINKVELLGNVQVTDTTRNVFALAGRIEYLDSISSVTLTREPAVISQTKEKDGKVDTVYLGADKLVYYTLRMCDVDSAAVEASNNRLKALEIDPVGEFRRKAAEAAKRAAAEAAKEDPNQRAKLAAQEKQAKQKGLPQLQDNQDLASEAPADSLAISDSLNVADSLSLQPEPLDTTRIGFLDAWKNVRIYKKDMQVVCDSLVYSDLDSLARLFIQPVVWQEEVRQYAADSISVVISNGTMEKASLMSEAFITIQEDPNHYNQIRGAEMTAYFDPEGGLYRFDALGMASALFFIEENGALATVNKTESKMLSAVFENGSIQKIYYYDSPKNDGYPVVQLTEAERQMKGFKWQPERRPADRKAVTKLSLRPSERKRFSRVAQPKYTQTEIYFPGYISDIKMQIAVRDSLRQIRERERALAEKNQEIQLADSLVVADSLESVGTQIDSMSMKTVSDSLAVKDSVSTTSDAAPLDAKALREARKAEREAAKQKKLQERDLKWAELDKRDAEKLKLKEEKKLEKLRKKKRKALKDAAKQAERDAMVVERYRLKFEKEKQKAEAKAAKKAEKASNKTSK